MGLHVALIGNGNWSQVHLKALAVSPHVSSVTLVGREQSKLAERAGQVPIVTATSTDLDAVLHNDSVDIVDIVLPHYLHTDTAVVALSAGKHVA